MKTIKLNIARGTVTAKLQAACREPGMPRAFFLKGGNKMKILLLILIIFSGCSFYRPAQPNLDSDCYYESIKYGQGNFEQEQRIYRSCLLKKDMKGGK